MGTSATLGSDGEHDLLTFAGQIFGETLDDRAVIAEDRESVADYLADTVVEFTQSPLPDAVSVLDPAGHDDLQSWLAAQVPLWFGTPCSAEQVGDAGWRCRLGGMLKSHFAFQNLLRDMARLGPRAVALDDLLAGLVRRLPPHADAHYPLLWLGSLLALVAHARQPRGVSLDAVRGEQDVAFFLQVKVEFWLRELRRMVASLDNPPRLTHRDDLGKAEQAQVWLPVIHCRDCHAAGWGATLPRTSPNQFDQDIQQFYSAFFAEDVSTRFLFPHGESADPKVSPNRQTASRRFECGVWSRALFWFPWAVALGVATPAAASGVPGLKFRLSGSLAAIPTAEGIWKRWRKAMPITTAAGICARTSSAWSPTNTPDCCHAARASGWSTASSPMSRLPAASMCSQLRRR